MNEQTVFVAFPGSSTLEFQTIERVPVYEPAQHGWINYYIHDQTITIVDEDCYVTRKCVRTGQMTWWQTRPSLQNVVTLGMKHRVEGLYFEFKQGGSILFSSKKGTCYWGPIQDAQTTEESLSCGSVTTTWYETSEQLWDNLADIHRRMTDPAMILEEETDTWWSLHTDKRWRRNTSIREEMEMDKDWLARVKKRLETNPNVYANEANRLAHEERIQRLEAAIASNQSILNPPDACPECRREGVCMCYT